MESNLLCYVWIGSMQAAFFVILSLLALLVIGRYIIDPAIAWFFRTFINDGKTLYWIPWRGGKVKPLPPILQEATKRGLRVKVGAFKRVPWDADYILDYDIRKYPLAVRSFPRKRKVWFITEPPVDCRYDRRWDDHYAAIYTYSDAEAGTGHMHKVHWRQHLDFVDNPIPFEQRKLCCIIARNKSSKHPDELYTERRRAIEFFDTHHPEKFGVYGERWGDEGYSTYGGVVDSKTETMQSYRFAICYENQHSLPGYITEKIFDCLVAGCIPIYRGAPNISDYVPSDCFIDGTRFPSYEALYAHISTISEEEHAGYVARIQAYLEEAKQGPFSPQEYAKVVGEALDHFQTA